MLFRSIIKTSSDLRKKDEIRKNVQEANLKQVTKERKERIKKLEEVHSVRNIGDRPQTSRYEQFKIGERPTTSGQYMKVTASKEELEKEKKKIKRLEIEEKRLKIEREENARLSQQKIEMNAQKKKRKDEYQRKLLQKKIEAFDSKAQRLKEYETAVMKERFYANLNGRLKTYHLKEELNRMAISNDYNLKRLDDIIAIYRPKISSDRPATNVQRIERKIADTLSAQYKDREHRSPTNEYDNNSF